MYETKEETLTPRLLSTTRIVKEQGYKLVTIGGTPPDSGRCWPRLSESKTGVKGQGSIEVINNSIKLGYKLG